MLSNVLSNVLSTLLSKCISRRYAEGEPGAALAMHQEAYVADVLKDSLGFAGAKMTRRIVGIAHVADLDSIADEEKRAACELRALKCGRRLMLEAAKLSIEDVLAIAGELRAA